MIQFAILAAVLMGLQILAAIVIFLVIALNIISTIVTRVPPISTAKKYFPIIFSRISINPETVISDLGCGSGDFLLAAAKLGPSRCYGYELSVMPYFYGLLKSIFYGQGKVEIRFQDFFRADLSRTDIAYVYLVPPLLERVAEKLRREMKPGAIALVKGQPLPGMVASQEIILDQSRGYMLYVYSF